MDNIFLTILNMSLTGSFVIIAICLARVLLKRAPKIISYGLWIVAGFRLIFPVSLESVFSLIPFKTQIIPPDIAFQTTPRINSGVMVVDDMISGALPVPALGASLNPLQIWVTIGAYVWLLGVVVLIIYGIISFRLLKGKMRGATLVETNLTGANIYETENIRSPFVLGFLKPGIYLPVGLSAQEREYIVLHEKTHINRRDHIVKFLAYFVLCFHWFNPLVWAAFLLMSADMEMACDERVLQKMGIETKKAYSLSLLSLATKRHGIGSSPLAFGEGGTKGRIKNVLKFKESPQIVIVVAVLLVTALCIGFALNRADGGNSEGNGVVEPKDLVEMDDQPKEYGYADAKTKKVMQILDEDHREIIVDSGFGWDLIPKQNVAYRDVKDLLMRYSGTDIGRYDNYEGTIKVTGYSTLPMGAESYLDEKMYLFVFAGDELITFCQLEDEAQFRALVEVCESARDQTNLKL
ncbi:MAG: M56 family metallopeptidase [Peptococcaceae bacterium]|nr:M56 family metallopeptidase [Peptococcaceae bacterium]